MRAGRWWSGLAIGARSLTVLQPAATGRKDTARAGAPDADDDEAGISRRRATAVTEPGEPAAGPSLDLVTAALRADSADLAIYARVLTESLGDALPAGWVTVDRDRPSMSDRVHGRPGQVSQITVRLGERVMTLGMRRGTPVAEICREVRGVVLSRQQVQLGVWAEELARALVVQAEQNAEAATALRRLVAGN